VRFRSALLALACTAAVAGGCATQNQCVAPPDVALRPVTFSTLDYGWGVRRYRIDLTDRHSAVELVFAAPLGGARVDAQATYDDLFQGRRIDGDVLRFEVTNPSAVWYDRFGYGPPYEGWLDVTVHYHARKPPELASVRVGARAPESKYPSAWCTDRSKSFWTSAKQRLRRL
jgi:hypothetical protein